MFLLSLPGLQWIDERSQEGKAHTCNGFACELNLNFPTTRKEEWFLLLTILFIVFGTGICPKEDDEYPRSFSYIADEVFSHFVSCTFLQHLMTNVYQSDHKEQTLEASVYESYTEKYI